MKDRVQGAVTAGVALVGAGVMAAVPAVQQAPEVLRSVHADVQLAAVEDRYTGSVPELFALSAQRSVTGLVSTPVGLATAAIALAQGGPDQTAAAYDILKEIVDGPMWAADPAIYAFDDLLSSPIGGDEFNDPTQPESDSAISQFRADVLIAARDDIKEAIGDSLGLGQSDDVDNRARSTLQHGWAPGSGCPAYAASRALSPRLSDSWPSHRVCNRVSTETTNRCTRHFRPISTRRTTSPIRLCSPSTTYCRRLQVAAIRRQIRHR